MIYQVREYYNFGEGLLAFFLLFGLFVAFFGVFGVLLFVGMIMLLLFLELV